MPKKITNLSEYKHSQTLEAWRKANKLKHEKIKREIGAIEPFTDFFRVSHETLSVKRFINMPPATKFLFIVLCKLRNRYQRGKAYFTRSTSQLTKDSGLSPSTVKRSIQTLHDQGFLIVAHRTGGRKRFQIVDAIRNKALGSK